MDYEEKKSMTKDICFQLRQITDELKEINIILKGLSQILERLYLYRDS